MDLRQPHEKLRAVNLLGHLIEVEIANTKLQGEVFYFTDKVLILRKSNEYLFLNLNKHEELQIICHSNSNSKPLKEELAEEVAKPN